MRQRLSLPLLALFTFASAAHAQVAQPFISSVTPPGGQRGTTVTFTVEGANLAGASEFLWSRPGVAAKVVFNAEQMREKPKLREGQTGALIIDKLTRNKLTVEAVIAADAAPGVYAFRVKTPLGTTNLGRFAVGSLPETAEMEMNDAAGAQEVKLPTTISGVISKPGDVDSYKFKAEAGQTIVFEVVASALGSGLNSVLTLTDAGGKTLATANGFDLKPDALLGYTFKESGEYVIRVSEFDVQQARAGNLNYRLSAGELPYVTSVFPLGLRQGAAGEVTLTGFNLSAERVQASAPAGALWDEAVTVQPVFAKGESLNALRLGVGRYPELTEQAAPHNSPATAQAVTLPVTINGRIFDAKSSKPDEDHYRFAARKGQQVIFEVGAQRFGSPLDSVIEVFDKQGRPVPRASLRCELETILVLRDHPSNGTGLRIESWNGMQPRDYVLVGNELLQIESLPDNPDEDTIFKGFAGNRLGMLETTPEAHAVSSKVYKVSVHPPDAQFSSNGLPVVKLYYRNDDGGPVYGKDSKLTFTAPADGEYFLKIRDVRGMQGERFAYRLSAHEAAPDFLLAVNPPNPNVPQGGQVALTVTATRLDGFDGEIEVKLLDLPAGFTATPGVIRRDMTSTVVLLSASNDAGGQFALKAQGAARVGNQTITREAMTKDLVAVASAAPPPELAVTTGAREVVLEPGGKVVVTVNAARQRGFAGRVPVNVLNLPPGVTVGNTGLNGVLITEAESAQKFTLEAEPWVEPLKQTVVVVGVIETTSPQQSAFPAQPVTLVVRPRERAASSKQE
jgi:hypothetical protein